MLALTQRDINPLGKSETMPLIPLALIGLGAFGALVWKARKDHQKK